METNNLTYASLLYTAINDFYGTPNAILDRLVWSVLYGKDTTLRPDGPESL